MKQMTQEEKKEFGIWKSTIEGKLNRVLYILESDDKTNSKGLVETVNYNHSSIQKIHRDNDVLKAKASVWGVVGAAAFTIITWIVQKIIQKEL
jgi:hypothetical protein